MEDSFAQGLANIIDDFENTKEHYKHFVKNGDGNRNTFLELQDRFVELKSSLRQYHTYFTNCWTRFDDKSATAIKFRIAVAISEGRYTDEEDPTIYDKCSITSAEKFASGSKKYRQFVEKRGFYKESLTNIADLREDISNYINLIKDRLKTN